MFSLVLQTVLEWQFDTRWSTDPTRGTAWYEFELDTTRMAEARDKERLEMVERVKTAAVTEALVYFAALIVLL